jgi:hypothetical protein
MGGIERKLLNGEYDSVDDFVRDMDDFFDSVSQVFGLSSDIGRAADRYAKEITRAFAQIGEREVGVSFESLRGQLERFAGVEVREIGVEELGKVDFEGIARGLNGLNGDRRLQAEWIIRIHCPTLPYYESGVDVTKLPPPALRSLEALITSINVS